MLDSMLNKILIRVIAKHRFAAKIPTKFVYTVDSTAILSFS